MASNHHHFEEEKSPLEDPDSWKGYLDRKKAKHHGNRHSKGGGHRQLRHYKKAHKLEDKREEEYNKYMEETKEQDKVLRKQNRKKRQEELEALWADPGIEEETTHGLMIDAGSTGSRLHIYEWAPRHLKSEKDIEDAVSGNKLSFPGTESRWTERLEPGISTFASYPDDQLRDAIAEYLKPLIDFSKTVLHEKENNYASFPIYLRATAGMRELQSDERARIIQTVRDLFSDETFCPFDFVDERARVLSGEEEAAYDWTGVNFVMGNLIDSSHGVGTVVNPKTTHGALDLGGGSTQIAFYESNEDIMANLYKLTVGQAKHWNIYGHSFLLYGMNAAIDRYHGMLSDGADIKQRIVEGIYNPCLPGGAELEVRTNVHFKNGIETWNFTEKYPSGDGSFQALLKNPNERSDPDLCLSTVEELLHLGKNDWCEFAHLGDCSFAGIYQARLPIQQSSFQEFLAFSGYYHVWKFLKLPERATIAEVQNATRTVCSMSKDELKDWHGEGSTKGDVNTYCFRSAYVLNLLHKGYGFQMNDTIRAVKVLSGHKVGWALGAMLYEINTLPWVNLYHKSIVEVAESTNEGVSLSWHTLVLCAIVISAVCSAIFVVQRRTILRYKMAGYETVNEVSLHQ